MAPTLKNQVQRGFPGGAVVESLPASAGDTGSSPGLGGSHMPRSNQVREPQLPSLCVWSLCSATREAEIVRGPRTAMKSGPHSPQLKKALAQKRRPNTAKKKKKKLGLEIIEIFAQIETLMMMIYFGLDISFEIVNNYYSTYYL